MAGSRRVVLVTGASTGLGLAISRRWLATDDHLILTARESSLGRFADEGIVQNERLWLRPLDVVVEEQRRRLVEEADDKLGGVDVLINNAGISYRSVIEHVTDQERAHQMSVNYHGPIGLVRLVLPSMRRKRAGRIVQISSAGGLMAMPTMGIYAASKFALEGASEALYYEVRPFGIHVSLVLPGFINSDGFEKVMLSGQSRHAGTDPSDPYHAHYAHMGAFISRIMRLTPSTPDGVARTVFKTARAASPKLRVPGTWDMRLLWMLRRVLPQRLYHEVLYRLLPEIGQWGKG